MLLGEVVDDSINIAMAGNLFWITGAWASLHLISLGERFGVTFGDRSRKCGFFKYCPRHLELRRA